MAPVERAGVDAKQNFMRGTEANGIINDRMKYSELDKYFLNKVEKRLNERNARRFIYSPFGHHRQKRSHAPRIQKTPVPQASLGVSPGRLCSEALRGDLIKGPH